MVDCDIELSIAIMAFITVLFTGLIPVIPSVVLVMPIPAFPVLVVMLAILSITESPDLVPAVCSDCTGKPVEAYHIPGTSVIRRTVPATITVYKIAAINKDEIIRAFYRY